MRRSLLFCIFSPALVPSFYIPAVIAQTGKSTAPQIRPAQPVTYDRPLIQDLDPPEGFNDTRGTCGNVVYSDGMTQAGAVWNIRYPNDPFWPFTYSGDDVTLAGTDRYACEISARLGTVDYAVTPSFLYTLEFWDVANTTVCPDSGATMLYRSIPQVASGFGGSFMARRFTTEINPVVFVPNSFWIIIRTSDTTDNPYIRFRTTSQPPDIGVTQDGHYVGYDNNRCDDPGHFVYFGGIWKVGLAFELRANSNPSGACCTHNATSNCVDNVILSDCSGYSQSWSPGACSQFSCTACAITCDANAIPESEPLCGLNYVDIINSGCDTEPHTFTDIVCGQTICGETGTYSCTNGTTTSVRRDSDWYRFSVTSPTTVTLSLQAEAALQMILYAALDPFEVCDTIPLSQSTSTYCPADSVDQELCPGIYYIRIAPIAPSGITCGSKYTLSLDCSPMTPVLCCKGDVNIDGSIDARDIRPFINLLLDPMLQPPTHNSCLMAARCRIDMNDDYVISEDDVPVFVGILLAGNPCAHNECIDASLLVSGTTASGSTSDQDFYGPVPSCDTSGNHTAPDVWYSWQSGPGGGPATFTLCPSGGTTDYDSILVVYSGPCDNLFEAGCNDDACVAGGASRVILNTTTPDSIYHICVSGWGGVGGNYSILVTQP